MATRKTILIVGAGFAGATFARVLAEAGYAIHLIDRRAHIGGNAYDAVDARGVRIHRYGPHLLHTSSDTVIAWLSRFTDWVPYQHRVRARLGDGRHVPLPINRETIETVFDRRFGSDGEVAAFLASVAVAREAPRNAAEFLHARIGVVLTDLFFRPYTKKMWDLDLEALHASVVRRIPLRCDDEDRYFPAERHQVLPADGYTALFERMLDHPGITVALSTPFSRGMEAGYRHCFNSMPIDEYFGFALGELPYRSIRFHHRAAAASRVPAWAVTNFTDQGKYTREAHWAALPGHVVAGGAETTFTLEEPCDYRENAFERYYPVKTADAWPEALYEKYRAMAGGLDGVDFIGRCGTYRYLDMDQVVNQSLQHAHEWLSRNAAA